MKCHEVMDYMQRYQDGDLNDLEQAEMRKHMRECTSCSEMFERLNRLSDELVNLPKITPPFSIVDSILPQLDEIDRTAGPVRSNRSSKAWKRFRQSVSVRTMGGLAAACIVLALVIVQGPSMLGSDQSADFDASMESSNQAGDSASSRSAIMYSEAADDTYNDAEMKGESTSEKMADTGDESPRMLEPKQAPVAESEGQGASGGGSTGDAGQRTGADARGEMEIAGEPEGAVMDAADPGGPVEQPSVPESELAPKASFTVTMTSDMNVIASPDGTFGAFVEAVEGGFQVVIMNGEQERIYAAPLKKADVVSELVWSSDGTALTYTAVTGDASETYIINIAARSEMQK